MSETTSAASGKLGQAYRSGGGHATATLLAPQAFGGAPLPAAAARSASHRFGFDLGRVRIHADDHADNLSRQVNADAFTVADNVFFRAGKYAPTRPEGDRLLHHELAHVAQFRQGLLGRPESELESQADRAAGGANAFRAAPAAALRPADPSPRLLRQVAPGPHCTGIDLTLPGTIVFHGTSGDFRLRVEAGLQLTAGTYQVTFDNRTNQLSIPSVAGGILFSVSGDLSGTKTQIKAKQDTFQAYLSSLAANPVTLTVLGAGTAPAGPEGAGKGGGAGGDHGGKGADPDAGADGGKSGGKLGGTGTAPLTTPPAGKPGGAGPGGGTSPVAQQGSGGTTVKITDPKQIAELRRLGLLDDKTAADIKEKSDKQQPIPFEELMALYKALSETMVLRPPARTSPSPAPSRKTGSRSPASSRPTAPSSAASKKPAREASPSTT